MLNRLTKQTTFFHRPARAYYDESSDCVKKLFIAPCPFFPLRVSPEMTGRACQPL